MFFSTLNTTLPHNSYRLIESTFQRGGSPFLACNDSNAFLTYDDQTRFKLWSCQNVCDASSYLLDIIFIRFGIKLHRQIVGIPMGTYWASLVAVLFLFCDERDFMMSLSDDLQVDIKLLTHLPDIWTTFWISTILTLKKCSLSFILMSCRTKLILLIPKPQF